MIKKILKFIKLSLTSDNAVSSTRIQSYLLLFAILLMIFVFVTIELWSFIHAIHSGQPYVMSNQFITIFVATLAHHLSVLFQRTKSQSVGDLLNKGTPDVQQDATPLANGPTLPPTN